MELFFKLAPSRVALLEVFERVTGKVGREKGHTAETDLTMRERRPQHCDQQKLARAFP